LKNGFSKVRQKGSHTFYRHEDGRYTTIPHHGSVDLARPLIWTILKEASLSVEEYQDFLKKK
jgi:predicted RNA binding protein YcfA (HicA-like mRNA interferase family)